MNSNKIIDQVRVLDNEIKFKIISLLTDEGTKSISDISKELKLNFSTTHKYLEQLEKAGLVKSKQETTSRLKRMFYIKDFNIKLSPNSISAIVKNKIYNQIQSDKGTFTIITDKGLSALFNKELFVKPYLEAGVPKNVIDFTLSSVVKNAYNGITIAELRSTFMNKLKERSNIINSCINIINNKSINERTYFNLLLMTHPEAIKAHMNGDIFISNLGRPRLLNFVHDIRGIYIHGISGYSPKNISDLLKNILLAVDSLSNFVYSTQCFDSFNYFIAPLVLGLSDAELKDNLLSFLNELNQRKNKFYINLETGIPIYLRNISTAFFVKKSGDVYSDYFKEAERISNIIINLLENKRFSNIHVTFKLNQKDYSILENKLNDFYVANMTHDWQDNNVSYIGNKARFDSRWKGWMRTTRIGEIQKVSINLPLIALKSNNISNFTSKLKTAIEQSILYHTSMAELIMGVILKKEQFTFKSTQRERWNYVQLTDSVYSISLAGIKKATVMLGTEKIIPEILKDCNNIINKYKNTPIRLELKEEHDNLIINRFSNINKLYANSIGKNYVSRAELPKPAINPKISPYQKYLLGGHCSNIRRKQDIIPAIERDGLIRVIKNDN